MDLGSPEEIHALAVAVFSTKDVDASVLRVATQLFAYAGNLGDHNAQYTYAQLLRMGKCVCVCVCACNNRSFVYRQWC